MLVAPPENKKQHSKGKQAGTNTYIVSRMDSVSYFSFHKGLQHGSQRLVLFGGIEQLIQRCHGQRIVMVETGWRRNSGGK
jgi:hypothetical protein